MFKKLEPLGCSNGVGLVSPLGRQGIVLGSSGRAGVDDRFTYHTEERRRGIKTPVPRACGGQDGELDSSDLCLEGRDLPPSLLQQPTAERWGAWS